MAAWLSPNTDSGIKFVDLAGITTSPFTDEWPNARDGNDGTSENETLAHSTAVASDGDYEYVDFEYTGSPDYWVDAVRIYWSPGSGWEIKIYVDGVLEATVTASGDITTEIDVVKASTVRVNLDYTGTGRSIGTLYEVEYRLGQPGRSGMMF